MQLTLFDATATVQRRESPPLVYLGDTTWRFELRFLWCPRARRGVVATEVTDDATRELVWWELRPGAHGGDELLEEVRHAVEALMDEWEHLDSPF